MRPCASTVRTFIPHWVLCAVGHGNLGRYPAWPLSWKTLCLCLNVSAQMSGVWSWGGFLWVTVGLHGPPRGQCWGRALSLSFWWVHLPWGSPRHLRQATWLLFSLWVMSDSLWSHGLQHTRLPCPSPFPGACSNSCPLSQWCHLTVSFSVIPFSSCLQSFPASRSFLVSWLFSSGSQSIGASASVLSKNVS